MEPPTRPHLECRRETGLILRCDRKVGNPFQTKQRILPSCPDQVGRRGSEEVVPENFGVPLSMAMNLSKLWEIVKDREAWHAAVHAVPKSWSRLSDCTTTTTKA